MTRGGYRLALVLLLAAAAGVAWWLVRPSGSGPQAEELAPDVGDGSAETRPADLATLESGAVHAGRRPGRLPRGEGSIVGTVRRDGTPVAARIAIRVDYVGGGYETYRRNAAWRYERAFDLPPTAASAVATVTAGDDGRFAIPDVGAGTYTLLAETADGATGTAMALVLAEGARVEVTIAVAGGPESLRGRVVYADGRPFAGTVVVGPWDDLRGGGNLSPQGKALPVDTEGRFVATGLPTGSASVTALVEGRLVVRSPAIPLPHAGEYVLTVDAGLRQVAGRVVRAEDEGAVAGADVLAAGYRPAQATVFSRATTDADGRFEVWVTEGGQAALFVRAEGFAPHVHQIMPATATETLVVRLVRGATATGRVTRETDGAPVPGLAVMALPLAGRGGSGVPPEPVTTDAEGRYTLTGLAPGEAMVVAQGQGYVTKGIEQATRQGYNPLLLTLTSGETVTVDVVVTLGARIDGVVLDPTGAPVAGALVLTAARGGMGAGGFSYGVAPDPVATARDGRFVIDGAVPGVAYTLSAQAPGFSGVQSAPVTAVLGTTTTVELRFAAARYVEVTVLDDGAGTPVGGARLLPIAWSGPRIGTPLTYVTAADGRCRVGPLPSGRQQFRVEASGYASSILAVAETETTAVARLARGVDVAGKVISSDGSPAPSVAVWAGRGRESMTTTAADGGFVLRGVAAGPVLLTAEGVVGGAIQRAEVTIDAGARDVVLRLGAPKDQEGTIRLVARVLDPEGRPVPRATATWRHARGSNGTGVTDGRAEWVVEEAAPAEAWIDVRGARSADGAPLPFGPATVRVPPGAKEVEIRLPPELAVTGTVRTADGTPVRGVAVTARTVTTDRASGGWMGEATVARTDAAGAFRLGGLGALDYDLAFAVPPEFAPVKPVRVRGGDRGVEVRLRTGAAVAVTVVDPAGQPVAGVVVRARVKSDEALRVWSDPRSRNDGAVTTDASGVARLRGLDAEAAYVLDVEARGDDLGGVHVDPWTPREETLRMPRVWTITGVVRDPSGRPVPHAMVLRREGTGSSGTGTDADGRFRLEGLSPGEVAIRAALAQSISAVDWQDRSGEVRVAAGTKDVVLTLDVGLELFVRIENPGEYGGNWANATLLVRRDGQVTTLNAHGDVMEAYRFQGLRAGDDCAFWLPPAVPSSDRSVYAAGLKPGTTARVRAAAGRAITGRLRAPAGAIDMNVGASQEGLGVGGRVNPDGTFELRGLPEGTTWTIQGHARSADNSTWYMGEATAKAGDAVEIALKPPEPPDAHADK